MTGGPDGGQMLPLALQGLRVVELGGGIAPAYCARMLADMGAETLRLEPPAGAADRRAGPFPNDMPDTERSGLSLYLNAGKQGATLEIALPSGRELLQRLLSGCDLLVHDVPPARAEAYALDFPALHVRHPRLVVAAISAFGASGPYRDFSGDDLTAFAMSGYAMTTTRGVADLRALPPRMGPFHSASFLAGVTAAGGALAALRRRDRSGTGGLVDVAVWEALVTALPQELAAELEGCQSRDRRAPDLLTRSLVFILPCRDGLIAVSPREEHLWRRLLELLGEPEWAAGERFRDQAARQAHWDELWELLAAYTRPRSKREITEAAQARRVPAFPLSTVRDLSDDPQLRARGFFAAVEHPVAGRIELPAAAYQFSRSPARPLRAAPLLGEHNAEVFCERLGLTPETLVGLRATGVI